MLNRIISILGANIFGQICTILIQFLGVPFFLNFWGKNLYGEWLVIIAIPTYLTVTGMGVGFVSGNKMQMLVANNKYNEAAFIFRNAWAMICSISVFFLLALIPIIYFLPVANLLNITHNSSDEVKTTLLIFSVYIIFSFINELFTAVYRANGNFARGIFLINIMRVLEFVGILIAIFFGAGIVVAALVYLFVRVLGIMWMIFECSKIEWLHISFKGASWSEVKSELKAIIFFLGVPMSQALVIQGMTTIIGIKLGPSFVVVFTVTRTLVNVIRQFASIMHNALLSEFSVSISTGDLRAARSLHRVAFQFTLWFVLISALTLYLLSDWVMLIWTKGQLKIDNLFLLLMLIVTIPNTLSTVSSFIPASINKFSLISSISIVNAIICTVFAYLLAPSLGLLSIPVVMLFTEFIMFCVAVRLSLRIVKDPFWAFVRNVFFTFPIRRIFRLKEFLLQKMVRG